jgi:RHS repeat-associated protein
VDDTLTTSVGSWQWCGYPVTHYYYQWLRNGTAISGATGSSYAVKVADVGATIKSEVEACDDQGDCSGFVQSSNSRIPISQPPNVPSGLWPYNYEEFDSTPTLESIFTDPDSSETGYVSYSIYRQSDNALVGQGSGPVVSSGNDSDWTPPTLAGEHWYYWYAQAGDASQSSSVTAAQYFYVNTPASQPTLQLPSSSSTLFTTTPVLSATASDAETVYFEFQVGTDSSFSNVVADSGWVAGTGNSGSWTVTPGALQRNRTYYWRARAEDVYAAEGDPNDPPSAWTTTAPSFTVSVSGLGANSSWPMWSHGPVSVNEASGNLVLSLPTPSYATATGSLTFSLTYNSQAPSSNSSGGLGQGWTLAGGDGSMSPPLRLIDHSVATPIYQGVEIDWPDGSASSYSQVGTAGQSTANTYLPASGDGSQLTHNPAPDQTWTLLDSDGTSYTFAAGANGTSYLTNAETPATSTGHGILSYTFDPSTHEITQLAYQDTATSPVSETLSFAWGANCNGGQNGDYLCVTSSRPQTPTWIYTASGQQITGVSDGTRPLLALSYGGNGLISEIQNANDLDPTHASPNYNSQHNLAIAYDSNTPAPRVSSVSDGPATTSQGPQTSTWSFGYHPGAVEPTPPRASHYGYLVRNAAPAAYYPLDETSGTTAVDVSGNGNNAAYSGSYTQGQQPGALAGSGGGTAVAFNGGTVSGSVSNLDLAPGGYSTVEMWINWNGTDNEMPFIFAGGAYDLWIYNGYFGFNSGHGDIWGTTAPTANTWHYVVAEFYNGSLTQSKLWLDGVQQSLSQVRQTGNFSATASAAFRISDTTYQFTGAIDEVAIYGYGLTPVQITSHFAEGVHEPAPAAYYRLDDANTSTAADSSGNGNNATYSGGYAQGTGVGGSSGWSASAVSFTGGANGGTVAGTVPNINTSPGGYNTVEFWMYWDGSAANGPMPFGFSGPGGYYDLEFDSGYFGFNTGSSDIYGINIPTGFASSWHYIVAEFYNGYPQSGAKLWIDGVAQALSIKKGTPNAPTVSSTFDISGWPHDGGYRIGGRIDDAAIYNTALTPAEIANQYGTNAPSGQPIAGTGKGTAAGYTTITPPNQQGPGKTCPTNCATAYYDSLSHPIETIDTLGRTTESGYNAQDNLLWSEDAAGNPTDYLYGGANGQPTGNPNVTEALLQTIQPAPDTSTPRPVATNRYDEATIGSTSTPGTPLTGLAASYWTGVNLTGTNGQPSLRENDPAPGSTATTFSLPTSGSWPLSGDSSARWSGDITTPSAGDYTLSTVSDGGTRLTIDGADAINNWTTPTSPASSQAIHLSAGLHQLVLDYKHSGTSSQTLTLQWLCSDCSQPISTASAIPLTDLAPAWLNQTSTISPAGRLSYSHYATPATGTPDATPALGEPEYTLVQAGGTNLITSYTYDAYGRMTQTIMPNGNKSPAVTIDSNGNLQGTPDTTYATTNTYYGDSDGDGDATSDTDSDGETYTASPPVACGGGNPISQYDQLESTTTHGEAPTTYVYDASGNTLAKTNGVGTTCSTYDSEQRLTSSQASGEPQPTTYTYDPAGAQLAASGPGVSYLGEFGNKVSNSNSLTKTITLTGAPGPGNAVFLRVANTTTAPSATAVTDSKGNTWTLVKQGTVGVPNSLYGTLQNVAPLASGDVVTVTWSTNVSGFAGVLDAFSGVRSLTPDQTTTATDNSGSTARNTGTTPTTTQASELQIAAWGINAVETSFTPTTGASQLHTPYLTNSAQTTTEAEYKVVNATGAYNLNASGGVSGKYNGFIVTLPAVAASTSTTYYDEQGRLVKETDSNGAQATYGYDPDGNQVSREANKQTLNGSCTGATPDYCTTYNYNAADQLTSETDSAGHTYQFCYDTRGNLRGTQYPTSTPTFSWVDTNPDGWITDQYNRHGSISSCPTSPPSDSSPLADYAYTYNLDGKRTSETRLSGSTSQTTSYSYDNLGRLSQVVLPGTGAPCRNYGYDLDSNRTSIQQYTTGCSGSSTSTTYTYNPAATPGLDELTSINTTNYAYTSDGQVSSQGTTHYAWDGLGRLKLASVGSNIVTYTYDPTGGLQTRTSSSPASTINYLLGDLLETNGSGTITTSYADGPGGNLASFNGPPTTSSTLTYLYYDAHGNLAAEANSSGSQTGNHTYDPFGAPLDTPPTNTTVHRFVGRWNKQYDTATGDILMGARPYDPTTGRFLSVDPIPGGSLNNYDYAGQDPINNYDLTGTFLGIHPLRWLNKGRHVIGKYGEEGAYAVYYGGHWLVHKTRYGILFTPFGPAIFGAEVLGLGGDVAFDKLEGARACEEHRHGRIHGRKYYLPGCGKGHIDIP